MMNKKIAVIGLGYVGLPLVVEFGKKFETLGFDISREKVDACLQGLDPSGELTFSEMKSAKYAFYTDDPNKLSESDYIIVAVPTPVDSANIPDFNPLISASSTIGRYMKKGVTVVYESTVYPGVTEDVCIPALEKASGMKWMRDFSVGYSPERINPGDKKHTLTKILKIVSGDTKDSLKRIAELYEEIIEPGVYRASSIKTAEAAKVIENTQRDVNIALMNELAIIFEKIGVDSTDVLEAAGTKWNFLKFKPGLVGGHCIGVDPYYLAYKAQMSGYYPKLISAGRLINDGMAKFIAEVTVRKLISSGVLIKGSKVNILGLTFKEDCADLRNSKVFDIVRELESYGVNVCVTDDLANKQEVKKEYDIDLIDWDSLPVSDAVIIAVAHNTYKNLSLQKISEKIKPKGVVIDVKSIMNRNEFIDSGFNFWRL